MTEDAWWAYLLDEFSLMGIVIGAVMAVFLMTWGDVEPELFDRGSFFLLIMGIGLVCYAMSGRFGYNILTRRLGSLLMVGLFIAIGVIVTMLAQYAVFIAVAPYLSQVPGDVRRVYLAMAGIAETYFLFGLYALIAGRTHPVIAAPLVTAVAWFDHNYVYGANPAALVAVAVSFLVQCLLFEVSKRFTVPLGIHLVVNLL